MSVPLSSVSSALARRAQSVVPRLTRTRRTYSTPNSQSPLHTRPKISKITSLSLVAAVSLTTYTVGSIYPPPVLDTLFPRPAPGPPDPTTPESIQYTEALEAELQRLPPLISQRDALDSSEWYETRPYAHFPEERRVNNLTAGALRGPGKLTLAPLVRCRKDESEAVAYIHLGRGLCGHDGIIHGGLLATLLDETLARIAISNLPDKVGVTANLSLNYRAPTKADQWVMIKTKLEKARGRKAVVTGTVFDLQGTTLVEATATFVQPKYAKMLLANNGALKKAMGERPEDVPGHLADGENLKAGLHS